MFNLGFSEILIIGVLALILIGPKQLPEVARIMGRMMKEFKQATKDLSGGLLDMKEELKKPMQDGLAAITDIEDSIYKQSGTIIEEVTDFDKTQEISLAATDEHKKTES
ncbi:MAG: twin-arginine translocase TatA/TatE family subunit [Bdellovibrionaceae bacterium]|nr:twin-arginine translocase TatA/TatE family subunit [Pseudobdellovibrionaceae bacterium]